MLLFIVVYMIFENDWKKLEATVEATGRPLWRPLGGHCNQYTRPEGVYTLGLRRYFARIWDCSCKTHSRSSTKDVKTSVVGANSQVAYTRETHSPLKLHCYM